MEYTVSKLAKISGVSARTLRYYDEINLLQPKRVNSSGYRIYGQEEVDLLQQILFYREMDLSLEEISELIHANDFTIRKALENHLVHLKNKKERLNRLILTVEQSIQSAEGERTMSDQEKFEAFKKAQIDENEAKYGEEIRQKYGDEVIDKSNKAFGKLSQAQVAKMQELTEELNGKLAQATEENRPESELAQEVCKLHQQWIIAAWPAGYYNEEKHFNLTKMYVEDERFKAYYEKIAPGAAEFLHEAMGIYLNKNE